LHFEEEKNRKKCHQHWLSEHKIYINNAMITNTFVLYGRVQWFKVDFLERHDIELFVINIVQRTGVQTFLFQISIKQ